MNGKIIVEIVGGLGNQLFQYALYLKLKKIYNENEVYIYLGRFNDTDDNKGFQISEYFEMCVPHVYEGDIDEYIDDSLSLLSRIKRKAFGRKESFILEVNGSCKIDFNHLDENKNYYIRGLWQREEYFKEISCEIRRAYNITDPDVINKWNDIFSLNETYVSLHVRRGDYISNPKYKKILDGVCDRNYYLNSISHMKKLVSLDVTFVVFSDDIEWVKKEFDFLNKEKVIYSSNERDIEDLYFMSKCSAHIIANSTFSWWGAWLNSNENKVVIAPKQWFKNKTSSSIVPRDWIRI